MNKELGKVNSRNVLKTVGVKSARPTVITVNQAAQRLGVSRSTVYRINRVCGPFLFIVDGRRIFIDVSSFELHLASIIGVHADDDSPRAESIRQILQPANEPKAESQVHESPIEMSETAGPGASLPASTSCGQRELIMRDRTGPCIICYPSFMT